MSMNISLRCEHLLGGVIALGTSILDETLEFVSNNVSPIGIEMLPIFYYHGTDDEFIFHEFSRKRFERLQQIGFRHVEMHKEEGLKHEISERQRVKVSEFLNRIMI